MCAPEVRRQLVRVPGVLEVEVDLPSKTATVVMKKGFDAAALTTALEEPYRATLRE